MLRGVGFDIVPEILDICSSQVGTKWRLLRACFNRHFHAHSADFFTQKEEQRICQIMVRRLRIVSLLFLVVLVLAQVSAEVLEFNADVENGGFVEPAEPLTFHAAQVILAHIHVILTFGFRTLLDEERYPKGHDIQHN